MAEGNRQSNGQGNMVYTGPPVPYRMRRAVYRHPRRRKPDYARRIGWALVVLVFGFLAFAVWRWGW